MNAFLHSLSQSDLTHYIGLTLAHTLWQGCAVALLLAGALRAMRHASAGARHVVACAALLLLLAAPIVTFFNLASPLPRVVDTPSLLSPLAVLNTTSPHDSPLPRVVDSENPDASSMGFTGIPDVPPPAPFEWHAWAVMAWFAGMGALTLWHGVGWLQLQRMRRRDVTPWSDEFAALARRMATRINLPCMPRVLWSTRVTGPVAFGCWHTVVLLPASMASGFTTVQIEMILAHEFAHLRRHDYLINLCQTAATTLLFFHPATWWINHVIRREREHACDDMAVAAVGDAAGYARTLVSLAEQEFTGAPALAPAALERKGALRRRIERLLFPPPSRLGTRFWPGLIMLALAALTWQTLPTPPTLAQDAASNAAPVRGEIRDRNGVVLAADSEDDVQICFTLREVAEAWIDKHGSDYPRTTRAVPRPKADVQKDWFAGPPDDRTAAAKPKGDTMDIEVPDIVKMFEAMALPKLERAGFKRPFDANRMRDRHVFGGALRGSERSAVDVFGSEPHMVWANLGPEEEKIARAVAADVPGMLVRKVKVRRYPFGAMASHVLGYVNLQKSNDSEQKTGAVGIELTLDDSLKSITDKNAPAARRGADVYLTLDARYQTIVERTLRESTPQIARGAVVLLEVNTGDVLAMASAPSFDPNDFVPAISQEKFDAYNKDETAPLLHRAVRGFVPGSTFKLATSLAGICTGHENDRFECKGGTTYGGRFMQCWIGQKGGDHGQFGLREAITASCGPYFYQLGNAAGNDALDQIATLCGLGVTSGILAEEAPGILPCKRWWDTNRPRDPFTPATIANISIGQGAVLTTPLQLASLTATVANGGTVWKPRLVDRIAPLGDASKAEAQPRVRSADLRAHGLTDSGLALLRGGMDDVVNSESGTATAARSSIIRIAGKTGTAQNWRFDGKATVRDNHTWFICYAPAEKPRWAMAIIVQGGKGGGVSAAPLARHILEQVSATEAGTLKVEPKPLAPIKGNFKPIEVVVPMKANS